ncbi:zinc knuckle CX2CX4HX4C containing protein [Tanacetum coccineum]
MEKGGSLLSSLASKVKNIDCDKASGTDYIGINNVKSDNKNVHDHRNYGNGGTKLISFTFIFKEQTNKKTVKLYALCNDEIVNGADVAIPLVAIKEVSTLFANTLYGYFIGKRLAFPIVEDYVKNAWEKYGIERVMLHDGFFFFKFSTKEGMKHVLENGSWLIRLILIILNIWTPNTRIKKDATITNPVWVKLYNVLIIAYSEIGLSLITAKLGRPIMLDAYTSNMCLKSWGRNNYARALIEVSSKHVLVDSLVVDEQCPKKVKVAAPTKVSDGGFVEVTRKHENEKQTAKSRHIDSFSTSQPKENEDPSASQPNNKGKDVLDLQEINVVTLKNSFDSLMEKDKFCEANNETWKASNDIKSIMDYCDSEEVEIVFVEDKGKPMNDLVDDARKKLEAFPKNSPKRNVVFSPETKIHYFDRDDMFFYDLGQATEEVEHENAYSTNG